MIKKVFAVAVAVGSMALAGCNKEYDDTAILNRVDELDNRVEILEELCKRMNTNIAALQTIVGALQENDCIKSVAPITSGGKTIGYTITFAKSEPITIYNGQDGKNGTDGKDGIDGANGKDAVAPVIGVKQDTDGVFYWTINGAWLKDAAGNKVQAEGRDGKNGQDGANGKDGQDGEDGKNGADGKDGQDGTNGKDGADGKDAVTPQLKIVADYWYISYDNGANWSQVGKATGEKGDKGDKGDTGEQGAGGGIFRSVQENADEVVFTLNDGSTIVIPKAQVSKFGIAFDNTDSINVLPNQTYEIGYAISGADESVLIDVVAQDYYKAIVVPTDYRTGKIVVTTPSTDLAASRVLVFVSLGQETIMRIINFVESVIIVSTNTVDVAADGETVQVKVETNVAYTVEIPELDQSWIAVADTRTATHEETLTFTVQPNPNTTYRYSTVNLKDGSGLVAQSVVFAQKASGYKTVHVATAGTLENYISASEKETLIGLKITGSLNTFDYDFMRTMPALEQVDIAQIDNTTIPANCFKSATIKTVVLPLKLTAIPDNAFYGSAITAIDIPATVTSIGTSAFYECKSLQGNLILPNELEKIGISAFYYCTKLTGDLVIPDSVTYIGANAFKYCWSFNGRLTLGTGIKYINSETFSGCKGFTGNLIIPDSVTTVGNQAFYDCYGFKGYLTIGSNVKTLGEKAFYMSGYKKVYCKAVNPPSFVWSSSFFYTLYLGVPKGSLSAYRLSDWKCFSQIEEIEF